MASMLVALRPAASGANAIWWGGGVTSHYLSAHGCSCNIRIIHIAYQARRPELSAQVVVPESQLPVSHSASERHQAPTGATSQAGSQTQSVGQSPPPVIHARQVELFGLVCASPLKRPTDNLVFTNADRIPNSNSRHGGVLVVPCNITVRNCTVRQRRAAVRRAGTAAAILVA